MSGVGGVQDRRPHTHQDRRVAARRQPDEATQRVQRPIGVARTGSSALRLRSQHDAAEPAVIEAEHLGRCLDHDPHLVVGSSPPGKPVPWAVEPTSTSRIVDGGSGGMSNTARSSPTSPPPMAPIRPAAGRSREATALAAASAGPAASMARLVGLLPSGCPAREGRDWAAPRTCPQAPPASASAAGRGLVGQRLRRGG